MAIHVIRLANANDIPLIRAIENQATDQTLLEAGRSASLLWVSQAPAQEVAGFLLAQSCDKALHIVQVSVSQILTRQGIGSELLTHLFTQANRLGYRYITATAAEHVRWSASFYLKNGYETVVDMSRFPHLANSGKVNLCKSLLR